MHGRPGIAVVVDRASGRVLAMNESAAERVGLPPGSTLKPFVVWALLASGKLTAAEALACPRTLTINGHNFTCSHPLLSAPVTAETALAYSCNNFVAHFAARLQPGELAAFLNSHGFRRASPLSGERALMQALGEEGVRITPAELARAYARLAAEAPPPVLQGLRSSLEYGTGRLAHVDGFSGKTGTADGRAWFAGFTADVAVAVVVPGSSGGGDAAPLAKQIVAPGGVWVGMAQRGAAPLRVYMTLEEYVAAALAGECGNFRSQEALRAMAVAVRTYALRHRGRHRREGYDLCDTTHCQLLRPQAVDGRLQEAAKATAGELLWHNGSLASVYYSQDCGGWTEAAGSVWPQSGKPYLTAVQDSFCVRPGRSEWEFALSPAQLHSVLESEGLTSPAHIESAVVSAHTSSGRAREVRLIGDGRDVRIAATALRFAVGRTMGWNSIRSMLFEIRRDGAQLVFHGYGAGHGVGLCQKGADAMGVAGRSYRDILAFYFPGAAIGLSAEGFAWRRLNGARIELMTATPARDQRLVPVADAALRRAEEITGLQARLRPLVRVYPTVAAFRDSTGESGAVAGDERGRVIRLQPNPPAQTVLHEMLHLVVESNIHAPTPLWFREGLVSLLAEDRVMPARMHSLAVRYDRPAMLSWLNTGLPKEVAAEAR